MFKPPEDVVIVTIEDADEQFQFQLGDTDVVIIRGAKVTEHGSYITTLLQEHATDHYTATLGSYTAEDS